jgi:hypothetical protein
MTDELERLAKLRDAGALDDAEFAAAKARLLVAEAAEAPGAPGRRVRPMAVVGLVLTLVATLAQTFLTVFVVPKFSQIFADMLGGMPLPAMTMIVMRGQWFFVGVGVVLSVIGSIFLQRRYTAGVLLTGAVGLGGWVLVTIGGLMLPLLAVIRQVQGPAGP